MAQDCSCAKTKRYAVVTGGNKGIGYEICRQLASKGITVILTARDEKKGLEATEKLKEIDGLSEFVIFHQLDVSDTASIASFADYVKAHIGKLDILVNNAAVIGTILNFGALEKAVELAGDWPENANWDEISTETYELAQECLKTNYYGVKELVEALHPFLQLSSSPRIVNVSSYLGLLMYISNEWAKGVFTDIESLTEGKIDTVLYEFLEDFRQGQTKGWSSYLSAYKVSKVALNAYTRLLARKYPNFRVNCVHPGFVKTDIIGNTGLLTSAEGADYVVEAVLLPDDGPSGQFFRMKEVSCF